MIFNKQAYGGNRDQLTLFPPPWKIDERKAERPLVSFTRTSTPILCIYLQNIVLNMIHSCGEVNLLTINIYLILK